MLNKLKSRIYLALRAAVHWYFGYRWRAYCARRAGEKSKSDPALFFGTVPVLNISYWSSALRDMGFRTATCVSAVYSINSAKDYDYVLSDEDAVARLLGGRRNGFFYNLCRDYLIFDHLLRNFDIFHLSYDGFRILPRKHWKLEIDLVKAKGSKIVVLPYGGDMAQLSKYDFAQSFKHGYLLHYPRMIAAETVIKERFEHLNKKADAIFCCANTITKVWTFMSPNYITIDMGKFAAAANRKYSDKDGRNGTVKIAHSPNHRFLKGTEFLLHAVDRLKAEGLKVELILLENISNDVVLKTLSEDADILVEQLLSGYALSAIEGMAAGLPVISNLDDHEYDKKMYRRFSFLNECPIVSANPEDIQETLRRLVESPGLRKTLGTASRRYAEKYHSAQTAQHVFGSLYRKIWKGEDVDMMNLFHPLLPDSYNNRSPLVEHPLVENRIPVSLADTKPKQTI